MKPILFVLLCLGQCLAMYQSTSNVISLTADNFDKKVLQSDQIWVVEFYATWCGHCQKFAAEYEKAAKALKGVINVGAVNGEENASLAAKYNIKGYPTIKIFASNKNKPEDYNNERKAKKLVEMVMAVANKHVFTQLGVKTNKFDSDNTNDNAVVELTDDNFDQMVMNSEDMWLVEFFAPWCGHCKNLEPHWKAAAAELKGKVKLGALDATVHNMKASQYEIKGYPTIKVFKSGKKDRSSISEYSGGRTSSDIVAYALELLAENIPAPDIIQLVDESKYKEHCEKKPLCIVSVLPHILDCDSACRNEYLNVLNEIGDSFKKKMWGWLWTQAGDQSDLETALDIGGSGYPAMAAVNIKKAKLSYLRGSFSFEGIREFLRDLSYGRGNTAPIRREDLLKVVTVDPWDGKDGELPVEEDIDLSDVILDDKDEL